MTDDSSDAAKATVASSDAPDGSVGSRPAYLSVSSVVHLGCCTRRSRQRRQHQVSPIRTRSFCRGGLEAETSSQPDGRTHAPRWRFRLSLSRFTASEVSTGVLLLLPTV